MIPPPPEVIEVDCDIVGCDGGGGALGHPLVYLRLDPVTHAVDCSYCDRRFVMAGLAHGGPAHATAH